MENDKLIRFIFSNNEKLSKLRTADPHRAQERMAFLAGLRSLVKYLEDEWAIKAESEPKRVIVIDSPERV